MSEITTVGLDLAKSVFQVHGADASGRAELRKKLRRDQVLAFFRLCCANAVKDSLCESSLLVRRHEQTEAADLPHDELV